jgi:hypothetical protein
MSSKQSDLHSQSSWLGACNSASLVPIQAHCLRCFFTAVIDVLQEWRFMNFHNISYISLNTTAWNLALHSEGRVEFKGLESKLPTRIFGVKKDEFKEKLIQLHSKRPKVSVLLTYLIRVQVSAHRPDVLTKVFPQFSSVPSGECRTSTLIWAASLHIFPNSLFTNHHVFRRYIIWTTDSVVIYPFFFFFFFFSVYILDPLACSNWELIFETLSPSRHLEGLLGRAIGLRGYSNRLNLLTKCMDPSHSWEHNSRAGSHEIPRLLWKPKVHYHTQKPATGSHAPYDPGQFKKTINK